MHIFLISVHLCPWTLFYSNAIYFRSIEHILKISLLTISVEILFNIFWSNVNGPRTAIDYIIDYLMQKISVCTNNGKLLCGACAFSGMNICIQQKLNAVNFRRIHSGKAEKIISCDLCSTMENYRPLLAAVFCVRYMLMKKEHIV